jgi:hypothetical protein
VLKHITSEACQAANCVVIAVQPLLHTIIFLIEMAVAARLAAKFNTYYAEKPGMSLSATSRRVLADMFPNSADDNGHQRRKPTPTSNLPRTIKLTK